jgi:hypothetical protein
MAAMASLTDSSPDAAGGRVFSIDSSLMRGLQLSNRTTLRPV